MALGFEHIGRKFVDRNFRRQEIRPSAHSLLEEAKREATVDPVQAFFLLHEAISLLNIEQNGGDRTLLSELVSQRAALCVSDSPAIDNTLFRGLRLNAYLSVHGADDKALPVFLYQNLFKLSPKRLQEQLVADLFCLALFEGRAAAKEILRALRDYGDFLSEEYQNPIIDLDLAKGVNPALPITAENLALFYYTAGLWKEMGAGMTYIKTNGILLNWALMAANLKSAYLLPIIRGSFALTGYQHTYPRGLVMVSTETKVSFRDDLLPVYPRFVAALKELKRAIEEERKEQRLINHDALLHASDEFISPAIIHLEAEMAA